MSHAYIFLCHSERSEESRMHQVCVPEILRDAQDDITYIFAPKNRFISSTGNPRRIA